ncbi:hypothetical protein AFLA_013393 [Aspergillus flavus NRRL3357]|nr:hypothetical protein AFLA_013393 [Aspergillus flavus NRRL3357]
MAMQPFTRLIRFNKLAPFFDIVVASPAGGEPPLDPYSIESTKDDPECVTFLKERCSVCKNTVKLDSLLAKISEFVGTFYVGGHDMFDLANDETSHILVRGFYESGKVVSAVCHASVVLINVKLTNGDYLVSDRRAETSFGAKVLVSGHNGKLVTGQIPASAALTGQTLIETDILINLSRINVLRAAFQNAAVLGMTPEWMCQDDTLSIFSTYGPWDMEKQGSIAPGLRPTTLQREIPHQLKLDISPFPRMRDNLIRLGDQLDDEEFAKEWGSFL